MEKLFASFVFEAENFFVTKFITNKKVKRVYSRFLDIVFKVTNDKSIDYNKGIFLYSKDYGQGKSFFFDVIYHLYKRHLKRHLFKRTTAKELATIYTSVEKGKNPEDELLAFIRVKTLYIDDIGNEGKYKVFHNYKNSLNVLEFVLTHRYEMWLKTNGDWRTFGSTNLSIEAIAQNYDGRVADRIKQMAYFEELDFLEKGSFRQVEETRTLTKEEIQANWDKFTVTAPVNKISYLDYMNGLLVESKDYLEIMGIASWTGVKDFMIKNNFLNESDFAHIDDEMIEAARLFERQQIRIHIGIILKDAVWAVQNQRKNEMYSEINRDQLYNIVQCGIAKKKFYELMEIPGFKFE